MSAGERKDSFSVLGELSEQVLAPAGFVVGVIEPGRHCRTQQGKGAPGGEARALPHPSRNNVLQQHARGDVVAKRDSLRRPVGTEEKCLHGISKIEVEHLIAGKPVHGGKGFGSEEIKNGGGGEPFAGVAGRERGEGKSEFGAVGLDEKAAFDGMGAKTKKFADFFGREHDESRCRRRARILRVEDTNAEAQRQEKICSEVSRKGEERANFPGHAGRGIRYTMWRLIFSVSDEIFRQPIA